MVVERTVFAGSKNSMKGFAFPFGCKTKPRNSLPGAEQTHENNTVRNMALALPAGVAIIEGFEAASQAIILFRAMP